MYKLRLLISALVAYTPAFADLRPLSTDRPDTTESPYSVDAGHSQIEVEAVSWTKQSGDDDWALAGINAKHGLAKNVDVQFVFTLLEEGGSDGVGFGDTEIRLKYNLWGNDVAGSALALMPFIKLPTASEDFGNEETEGGLIIPASVPLPEPWGLFIMAEADYLADDGRYWEYTASASLSREMGPRWGMFWELVGVSAPDTDADEQAYGNSGCTIALAEFSQLDFGLNAGLNRASDDVRLFVGYSQKY